MSEGKRYFAKRTDEVTQLESDNREIAYEAAAEGMVLLENDGILPIKGAARIALFGNGARKTVKGGTGSGDVNERKSISVEDGLEQEGFEITTKAWLDRYDQFWEEDRIRWKKELEEIAEERKVPFVIAYLETLHLLPTMGVETKDLADADLAVYVIGRRSGEGIDRIAGAGDYYLSEQEKEGLLTIKEHYKKLVVIINAGGPVDTVFIKSYIMPSALLVMSQAGMEGGRALAALLSGKCTPSGKLTDTWAEDYYDYPEAGNFSKYSSNPHEIYYREDIYVGYRYFSTIGKKVSYCFGYGKSYTKFNIEIIEAGVQNGAVEFVCSVRNTGNFCGKEVVQIYMHPPKGMLNKPSRVLVGFEKTELIAPGETWQGSIRCPLETIAFYDTDTMEEQIEPGVYEFFAGSSLEDVKPVLRLEWKNRLCLSKLNSVFELKKEFQKIAVSEDEKQQEFPYQLTVDAEAPEMKSVIHENNALEEKVSEILGQADTEQLIQLVVGAAREEQRSIVGNAAESVPGAAGQTSGCIEGIPPVVMADGGSGIRLFHHFQTTESGEVLENDGMAGLERGAFAAPAKPQKDAVDYYQYCTAFPIGTLLAQSWNREICQAVGAAVGREMEEFGVHIWLAPSINIHRNPLCGRNFEYYSEDPLLTGYLAAAVCKGVQQNPHAAVTIKHFAANNQELYRHSSDSIVSERALREIYLKPFEIVVKTAHPFAIMTSYNCINGVQAANNRDLCTVVARDEWGFDGFIMTDWGTTDPGDSDPVLCIQCGNDLVMPGGERDKNRLREAVQEGRLKREELLKAAGHIAKVALQLRGL